MKINFETLSANQNIEKGINTQSNATFHKTDKVGGFALDTPEIAMDNSAYGVQGKSVEEVMQNAGQINVALQQDYMTVMSNSMSQEDFGKLKEKGFRPGEIDVETMVTVVDEIKATLAEAGVEIAGYNDDLDLDKLTKITGSTSRAINIADKLAKNDVPVTKENVSEVNVALEKAEQIVSLSDGATKYMVQNQKDPTINNMYLAQFSSITDGNKQGRGYYADELPGYYSKKADDFHWDRITTQMEKVVKEAGYEVNDKTMADAKWIVEKGIPLTDTSFSNLSQIKSIKLPQQTDEIINSIAFALADGKQAKDALLTEKESTLDQAVMLVNTVNSISEQAIFEVVEQGKTLNIANLRAAQINWQDVTSKVNNQNNRLNTTITTDTDIKDSQKALSLITAKRQLEEVRLQMTVQANSKLLRSGYSIETVELGKLVEDLKAVEQQQKDILFSGSGTASIDEKDSLYKDTLTKVSEISSMPAAVIGKVAATASIFTLNYVHIQGTVLKSTYENANQTYEALMTAPRADLGDSIKKAFRNVDDILADLNLEVSNTNRRAVRILGYNSMYVNKENIEAVKDADLALTRVVEKMTPATTLEMIREGINPLNMDVKELDEYLTNLNKNSVDESEKYSKYLYKLEKNSEITQTEKQAYIGIYRLFHQIEKTDGAVIGSLINQGAELSFKNLLSQVRNNSKKGIDYSIDDNFGGLKDITENGISISQQIEAGFENQTGDDNKENDRENNLEKYYNRLMSEIYENLEPEKIARINLTGSTTVEEIANQLRQETLDTKLEREYLKEQFSDIRQIKEVEDSVIRALIDFDQPVSADNLLATNYLMQYRGSTFRQLFEHARENDKNVDNKGNTTGIKISDSDNLEQAMMKVQRNMTDQESATSAYENLKLVADEVLENAANTNANYIDIRSINMFHKQISVANNLAKQENYEVPIRINDEITSINLRIIHNVNESGKVTATLQTADWGRVSAEFVITDQGVSGYMACSSIEGIEHLKEAEKSLIEDLSTDIREVKELYFVHSKDLDLHNFQKNAVNSQGESKKVSTSELYEVAKAFIVSLQNLQINR